jgi:arsenite methyltransferase
MEAQAHSLRTVVREKYAAVARGEVLSCCGPSGSADDVNMIGDAYEGVEGYVPDADLKLGCGLPVEHAGLAEGQTVLDLGAGAGLDAFVARRIVGDTGLVLGVDFTPEMVEKARANAAKLGYANVQFEHGDIEALPFAEASVDVVISNCVLNLVPNKARAFAEMARVIRPGGHFCVSDVVTRGDLPPAVRQSAELYAGCVAGALPEADYLALLAEAGFEGVEVVKARPINLPEALGASGALWSVTVRGLRPASGVPHTPSPERTAIPTLRIYEPALCCSTGLCGPDPDAALVQFAADAKALVAEGVAVERYNLAQAPAAFVAEPAVVAALNTLGTSVLPLVVRDGRIVSHGRYPSRAELEAFAVGPEPAAEEEPAFPLDLAGACAPGTGCC